MISDPLPTVLVPGLGCTGAIFEAVLPVIQQHGPVVIADVTQDDSIGGIAQRLLNAAPARFALIGFSMGGFVLAEVARQAPQRLRALGFVSSTPSPDTPEQLARRHAQLAMVRGYRFDELTDNVFPNLVGEAMGALWSRMAHEVGPEVFARQIEAIIDRRDNRAALAAITRPTAVVHGVADQVVPVERVEQFTELIPHVVTTLIDGGSHFSVRDRPDDVGPALSALLDRVTSHRP